MQLGKHHTKFLFHQACSVPSNKRKMFLTVGMFITVFPFMNMTITLALSLNHGDAIIIKHYKVPQSYISSRNGCTSHFNEIVSDVQNMAKCVNDSLLWSNDSQSSFSRSGLTWFVCLRWHHPPPQQVPVWAGNSHFFRIWNINGPCEAMPEIHWGLCQLSNTWHPQHQLWFGLIDLVS